MELWRELLINGLQNESYKVDYINNTILKEIIESESYKLLQLIKQTIDDEKLSDEDCFLKIEKLLCLLEKNNVFCDRHDFI